MFFVTNRSFKEGLQTIPGRKVSFDLDNNAPSNSIYFCVRNGPQDYTEVGSAQFLTAVRCSPYKEVLLFIHGFNTLPEDSIFSNAQILQTLFDQLEPNLIQVIPLIWPCDNDFGIVKDYWDDQQSADMSAFSFARALEKFIQLRDTSLPEICLKRINVLAHSMGNRVLEGSLRAWHHYYLPQGIPQLFRNVFMAAPDLPNEALEKGQNGELICDAARNVCVYFASDDWGLRASKVINLKSMIASRRLGHTGPENISNAPKNVYALDCDEFNNTYDPPIGHTYFLQEPQGPNPKPGLVLEHMYKTIKTGRVFPGELEQRIGILQRA